MQSATCVPCQTRRRGPKRHARSRQSRPKPAFVHPNACAHEPPHWATYNNIPYRLSDIVGMARCRDDVSPMDSSLRTLQRTLLLVAAYCRFEAVDKGWHDLVDVALDGNTKLGMDGLRGGGVVGSLGSCLQARFFTKKHAFALTRYSTSAGSEFTY